METKIIAYLVALIALVGGVWWLTQHSYTKGYKAGSAEIQTQWDQDKAAIQKTADAAIAAATKERDDALAANEGISSDLQTQLSSARALNGQLANSLRQYQARAAASSGAVPKAGSGQGATTTPSTPSLGQLDAATGAALTECYSDRLEYEALIKEIIAQL